MAYQIKHPWTLLLAALLLWIGQSTAHAGSQPQTLTWNAAHQVQLVGLRKTPDNAYVLYRDGSGQLFLLNLATETRHKISGNLITDFFVSADETQLILLSSGKVELRDIQTDTRLNDSYFRWAGKTPFIAYNPASGTVLRLFVENKHLLFESVNLTTGEKLSKKIRRKKDFQDTHDVLMLSRDDREAAIHHPDGFMIFDLPSLKYRISATLPATFESFDTTPMLRPAINPYAAENWKPAPTHNDVLDNASKNALLLHGKISPTPRFHLVEQGEIAKQDHKKRYSLVYAKHTGASSFHDRLLYSLYITEQGNFLPLRRNGDMLEYPVDTPQTALSPLIDSSTRVLLKTDSGMTWHGRVRNHQWNNTLYGEDARQDFTIEMVMEENRITRNPIYRYREHRYDGGLDDEWRMHGDGMLNRAEEGRYHLTSTHGKITRLNYKIDLDGRRISGPFNNMYNLTGPATITYTNHADQQVTIKGALHNGAYQGDFTTTVGDKVFRSRYNRSSLTDGTDLFGGLRDTRPGELLNRRQYLNRHGQQLVQEYMKKAVEAGSSTEGFTYIDSRHRHGNNMPITANPGPGIYRVAIVYVGDGTPRLSNINIDKKLVEDGPQFREGHLQVRSYTIGLAGSNTRLDGIAEAGAPGHFGVIIFRMRQPPR